MYVSLHLHPVLMVNDIDSACWENIRLLPNPPEFTTGLPTPSPRILHFTDDGHLIVTYLDHGFV